MPWLHFTRQFDDKTPSTWRRYARDETVLVTTACAARALAARAARKIKSPARGQAADPNALT